MMRITLCYVIFVLVALGSLLIILGRIIHLNRADTVDENVDPSEHCEDDSILQGIMTIAYLNIRILGQRLEILYLDATRMWLRARLFILKHLQ